MTEAAQSEVYEEQGLRWRLRLGIQSDVNFIADSWIKSLREREKGGREGQVWRFVRARYLTSTIFYRGHHRVLERLIPASRVIIACDDQEPDHILGYVVGDDYHPTHIYLREVHKEVEVVAPVVHWCYVKQSYRRRGVGKALLQALGVTADGPTIVSHWTEWCVRNAERFRLVHDPYLAHVELQQ